MSLIIETRIVHGILRVAAVDAETGEEIVFQAPAHTSRQEIDKLAAQKMAYLKGKKR
ncbi:MAG: hypothetical protein JO126_01735 [Alphaproteobacteria bacterium]|nr:hypothetical protein [Alphaproteobacteria bacterium]MBV8548159.1 hypothetical protein [Alphaproteobacteria bacterium]